MKSGRGTSIRQARISRYKSRGGGQEGEGGACCLKIMKTSFSIVWVFRAVQKRVLMRVLSRKQKISMNGRPYGRDSARC